MTDVLQFGTSRFLQAHADLFFHEGEPPRTVTVVQTSGDAARARRLAALAAPEGYPVRIRGLDGGRTVDETRHVMSVRRTLSTATDWPAVEEAAIAARWIVSNTADAGFEPQPGDTDPASDPADISFPAKLCRLLAARHAAGGAPLTILPTELISDNGNVLHDRVRRIAAESGAAAGFVAWLDTCLWMNSLVDRIVSEPIEPAGAVAEPYALWAIEDRPGFEPPCRHADIDVVADLEPIARLKLHILNLGHTLIAERWLAEGAGERVFVRNVIDEAWGSEAFAILREEVLPGFVRRGLGEEAGRYLETTLERLRNPFLDHALADIAQNHAQKAERRIGGFLAWTGMDTADAPRLAATLARIAAR